MVRDLFLLHFLNLEFSGATRHYDGWGGLSRGRPLLFRGWIDASKDRLVILRQLSVALELFSFLNFDEFRLTTARSVSESILRAAHGMAMTSTQFN